MFKCPVCGFLTENYDEVKSHIREQHPDKKVTSIPVVDPPESVRIQAGKLAQDQAGEPTEDSSYQLLVSIVKEILPQLTKEDLDEITSIIRKERTRMRKEESESPEDILTP